MTNPSNAIGTNGAYGGRTSVNAFNDVLGAFSRGVLSGWECAPNSGLTVSLGGNGTTRDVAIAEDNAGNRTTIDNISGSPVDVTMSAAPAANSRVDAIVAYVDNPPTGTSTVADNPAACGIIAVDGIAAGSPVAPDDNAIRTAITADGASGSTAYYVVLATITIATGTTDIVAGDITAGALSITVNTTPDITYYDTVTDSGFTSETTLSTLNILEPGVYYCTAILGGLANSDSDSVQCRIKQNGTQMVTNVFSNITRGINTRWAGSVATVIVCNANNVITLTGECLTGASVRTGEYFVAQKIG